MTTAPAGALVYDDAAEQRHRTLRAESLLDPDIVFLNHGSFGACPAPVFERYQAWQRELEGQPVDFLSRRIRGLMADSRERLAAYIGAERDEVVYMPNVTTALNVVARSLPLVAGDEILTADHEYGALRRTWTFVCEHRGTQPVVRTLPPRLGEPEELVETIWAGVTPRTRVLFLSHITSPTAIILPIEPLIRRAREAGIWTVIDGAHAPSQIPLDMHALGVDFYGGNCHKWLSSPKGAGFLYVRRELQELIEPLVVSWGWRPEETPPSFFVDQLERHGTDEPAAALSVPAAIDYQAERDWDRVRAECHELVRFARARAFELTGAEPVVPDDARWFSQMAVLPLPPCDVQSLKRRLWDEYRVEIPQTHWGEQPCLRISVQGYVTRADVERLMDALAELLPQVRTA